MSTPYTHATLKASLLSWNENADPEFESHLDEIIQRGEASLMRALDLGLTNESNDTATTASAAEVFKPLNLIAEKEVWVTVGSTTTPLLRRSPAWVRMLGSTPGTPKYYCDLDANRWNVGPPADGQYVIDVVGEYSTFPSITDGSDNQTSWFGDNVPDLLHVACSIEACEYLKFWAHKDRLLQEFGAKVAIFRGDTPNLKRADPEDKLGDRSSQNLTTPPGT